jgi:hypothetical protein
MTQIESKEESVVAVYKLHPDAENAVNLLKKNSFNIKNVAVVGQSDQTKEHVTAYYSTGDRMKHWGKNGAFWSGMFVLLAGSAVFAIPGVGLVMVAGSAVPWIVGVLDTALGALETAVVVGGLSALGAGLYSRGMDKDRALRYENAVKAGSFLVIAHGTPEEAESARRILADTHPEDIRVYQPGPPAVAT